MFASRKKPQDFQTSLQRFTDLGREPASRAKHLKIVLDTLNPEEKRQFIECFSYECFHLANVLMLAHYESSIEQQTVADVESALSILEQVLLFAPELVGRGWQRNGIEFMLKLVLHPNNVIAVRRLAIRLFIIWYQILAVSGHNRAHQLDLVFQCCLPSFPLRGRQKSTEQILTFYCEAGTTAQTNSSVTSAAGFEPSAARGTPVMPMPESNTTAIKNQPPATAAVAAQEQQQQTQPAQAATKAVLRERAETLQLYLDKFLEYTLRETAKIQWADPAQRLDCAKFLLDRIVVLYVYELFPDAEANGIDVYDGWEGTFDEDTSSQPLLLDTADPMIISKYWLIRWMANIAFESAEPNVPQASSKSNSPGIQLFREALFSSQKAVNVLLTLIRESFCLPLPCVNVIQKTLQLLRHWLLQQRAVPPFVGHERVSSDGWSLLLIRMLFAFFRSPYLAMMASSSSSGSADKLPFALSIVNQILQIVRDLANPSANPNALVKPIWQELIRELLAAVHWATSRPDAFGKATAAGFTRTLISVLIFVRVIRQVDIADAVWDELLAVFQATVWPWQVMEQWARIVPNLTRALVLNIFAIEIGTPKRANDLLPDQSSENAQRTPSDATARAGSYNGSSGTSTTAGAGSGRGPCLCADGEEGEEEEELMDGGRRSLPSEGRGGEGSGSSSELLGIVQQEAGAASASTWVRQWMRVVCLAGSCHSSPCSSSPHSSQQLLLLAVQTLGHSIQLLLQCGDCARPLASWLCGHIIAGVHVRLGDVASTAVVAATIPTISALLLIGPAPLERAHCLGHLLECLRRAASEGEEDQAQLLSVPLLEHIPRLVNNSLEDMAVISSETISTLQKLVKNQEFSSRAIRVAALLSLNHPEAEKILISLLEQHQLQQVQVDQHSLALCVNALCLLVVERADAVLLDRLLVLLASHVQSAPRILPIFCANLGGLLLRLGLNTQLLDALMVALSKVRNGNALNDLKWLFCAIASSKQHIRPPHWHALSDSFSSANDLFFESFVLRHAGQFPLPGFHCSQWNSLPSPQRQQQAGEEECQNNTFLETEGAVLSLDRADQQILWTRTCLGKFAYKLEPVWLDEEQNSLVDEWLGSLGDEAVFASQQVATASSARRRSTDDYFDPFKEFPNPSLRSFGSSNSSTNAEKIQQKAELIPLDISVPEMLQFIQASSRSPEDLLAGQVNKEEEEEAEEGLCNGNGGGEFAPSCWAQFLAGMGLLEGAKSGPQPNFQRELRHLDGTGAREVHKVALIFVGKDQQDKQSILSNTTGSEQFNRFVDAIGWPVQMGSSSFFGYTGGLPQGQTAPYYATANTELVFHVSTMLSGDCTQRHKHLGNDEVQVVWSEDTKPYRRELMATRFCDVLIVLYTVSPVLLRVHIELQDQHIQFGPLFDGACIHTHQAASLVRETVLNASRAYRNLRVECDRPNKHREKVFAETKARLQRQPLSTSIVRLRGTAPSK